ncbi:MAG: biotin--[acetyl-CoA-carboxylase] ligase [Anaerovoracaceae bacterium]
MSIKSEILKNLEENKGAAISGESLAETLGVSRTAVWKAINSLRKEGYQIEADSGKGYTLSAQSDFLSKEGILPYLNTPVPILVYDSLESTNKTATALAMEGGAYQTTILAGTQTKGRGRLGRSFYSPEGTGIYMSMILEPSFDLRKAVLITAAASVAVAKAMEKVCQVKPEIKWVNDVYVNQKKVCGILTEAVSNVETGQITHLILGIGINCFTEHFPEEAGEYAGSIQGEFSKNQLAAQVINEVLAVMETLEERSFIGYYRQHSMILGKPIKAFRLGREGSRNGTAVAIDDNGALVIEYDDDGTTEVLSSGEISIRLGDKHD